MKYMGSKARFTKLKTSLGKELEYKDPYVPTGSLKNFKQYQVLDEKNNDIGSVVIEYRGDKTVILHPKLTITGKGYGKDLYKLIASKFNVDIQEWNEGAIANSNAAKKMWDSLEKEGVAKRIVDEEQGDNFRFLRYNNQITPEQKQQAQQLYSQYLESLNKPNTNPILQGNQEEQVKKFVELQERLNNKEFLEGAKNAFESSEELQQFGTQEEYNDYIARVSLGIVKNPTSGEYNYESKVKDIVYHGGEKTFEQFSLETGNRASGTSQIKKGIYFTNKKNVAKTYVYSKETATIKAFSSIISSMEYSLGIKKLTKEEEMYGVDIPTKSSDTIKKVEKEYNIVLKGTANDFNSIRYDDNTYYSIAGNIDLSKVDGELLLSYLRNDNIKGVKSLYENYIKENKPSEKLYLVLINLINPTTLNNNGKLTSIYNILSQNIEKANNAQSLIINDVNDQIKSEFKEITDTDSEITYVVFEPEQIHILGSKQDIEGFKEFVSKSIQPTESNRNYYEGNIKLGVSELFESNPTLANAVYEDLGFKTKPDVMLPIGTSGSGKSTFIKSLPQENLVVIEPDAMRVEFTGNMNDKSKDKEIYEEAAKRAVVAIKQGKQVVFDTTNLTKDKRLPFIKAIKKEIPAANIQYKLMELNPELAKQRIKAQLAKGENRAAVSDETIDRHAASYKQMLEDIKSEPISNYEITPQQTGGDF